VVGEAHHKDLSLLDIVAKQVGVNFA
jgi:hypothetical protein